MLDIKTLRSALEQLEEERKIPKAKIIDAIEQALAAAYKKDYGKRGQIIRGKFDLESGKTDFFQVKIVVDDSLVRVLPEGEEGVEIEEEVDPNDERVRFNPEHHIMLEDARKIKKGVELNDEIIFPLESKEDYGRIAAQTAKQVIIQRIREAERTSVMDEYGNREGEVISGIVSKVERGIIYVDFNRATGMIPYEEQIPSEHFSRGQRIKAYLYAVEESPRGVNLRLSRAHPKLIEALFAQEAPEIAAGTVEIKAIAREAGNRSKIAVHSNDEHVDPVGSCVGQKGIRVTTVMGELSGEKIDIIPWSADPRIFVSNALSPAKALDIVIDEQDHKATIEVADDQLSLAIGKGGQNVRLAAKLTGWRIDIKGVKGEEVVSSDEAEGDAFDKSEGTVIIASKKEASQESKNELKDAVAEATASEEKPKKTRKKKAETEEEIEA